MTETNKATPMHKRWTFSMRLAAGIMLILALAIVVLIHGAVAMRDLNERIRDLAHVQLARAEAASQILDNLDAAISSVRDVILQTGGSSQQASVDGLRRLQADNTRILQALERSSAREERDLARQISEVREAYNSALEEVIQLAVAGKRDAATDALYTQVKPRQELVVKRVADAKHEMMVEARRSAERGQSAASTALAWSLGLGGLMLLAGIGLTAVTARTVQREIGAEPACC